ncbi:MAG: tryptophan synthase subunit alpha [Bryobacteraceae bacterium]
MQNRSTRISRLFERLHQEGRPGLIAYLTAGDPCPERTASLVAALEKGGADLIELGVPFSDPIADGPVIQRAASRALQAGTTVERVLQIADQIRQKSEIPLVLFTYLNPVLRYGFEKLAQDAVARGIDGCLLTDLSVEEAGKYVAVMRQHHLDTVFLAAPTSTERRQRLVAEYSSGFIYLVSRTGVTGEQTSVSAAAAALVNSMRAVSSLPLAVGFGIANRAHAVEVGRLADAVVVGSAFVRIVEQNLADASLERKLEALALELRDGLNQASREPGQDITAKT